VDTSKRQVNFLAGGVLMAHKYDREFKVESIRMAAEEGVSARGVEQRLGLSAGIISRWKRQLKIQGDGAFPGTGHLGDRDEEVRRLRRELTRVSQERDILKKAAAFFAKESR
jgi:transposase